MEAQLRCALPSRDAMTTAVGELGIAEAKFARAQQQLVEKRAALAEQLDLVDAFAASEHSSAQSLGSAAAAVRQKLQGTPSGLDHRFGAAGALLVELRAVRDQMDASDAEANARADLHNDERCLALRVLAMPDVREKILGDTMIRQLGRHRRVCKDWHRWHTQVYGQRACDRRFGRPDGTISCCIGVAATGADDTNVSTLCFQALLPPLW